MIKRISFIILFSTSLLAQGSGTPSQLRVLTDANNYLLVVAATQTLPLSNPTVFTNTRLKTDASGSLQVVLTGTVTPTYPLAIPASTCAAPSLGESGATTTGIAFTATPSILNCISGTNETILTATEFTPGANDGNALGSATVSWADLFLASGGVINWVNGNLTLTHSTGNLNLAGATFTATSGSFNIFSITPTYNQASGTAANTDLLINRTQTAVGSGAQLLIDARVSTISKFSVTNTGVGTLATSMIAGGSTYATGITFASGNVSIVSTNGYIIDLGGGSAFTIRDAGNSKSINLIPNGISTFPLTISATGWLLNNILWESSTAPTVSSGFGSSPSIASNNGTAAFTINVGTGGTASAGVIGLTTATTGWIVKCQDLTTPGTNDTKMTATSTTTATITNYNTTTGIAAAWTASDILYCQASAF